MDRLYIINGKDIVENTKKLLIKASPFKNLSKETIFGIKPNLVCSTPACTGATTHPEIVEGIIIHLLDNGFKNIKIMESSWIGDSTEKAFEVCGYNNLRDKYNVELIDLKKDNFIKKSYKGLEMRICKKTYEIDYLINVPLIKGHCQTKITCALKNMKGLIPDTEKRRFHTLGLHKPIAYLNKLIKQDLIVADAICPDPYFEEGGRPLEMNRIVLSGDPVLMDSYAAQILGYKNNEVEYINIAEKEGVGKKLMSANQIVEINSNCSNDIEITQIEEKYLNLIDDISACSNCYSNLVNALHKLDRENKTGRITENISIGQGYENKSGELGIGDCTKKFRKHLKGCPPNTKEIIEFLKYNIY
jgi:uncharacterized protein (DUF362 family)